LQTAKRLCYLNITPDEVVRAAYYLKPLASVVTVSVFRGDLFSALHCRMVLLADVADGKPERGQPLFEKELLRRPGFVELDCSSLTALTFSSNTHEFKLWELRSMQLLWSLRDANVHEMKLGAGGVVLAMHAREGHSLRVELRATVSGELLHSLQLPLHRGRRVEIAELAGDRLLLKEEGEALQLLDLRDGSVATAPHADFAPPVNVVALPDQHAFLAARDRQLAVWNLRGQLLTCFPHLTLYHYYAQHAQTVIINASQDAVAAYCRDSQLKPVIVIADLITGRSLARIASHDERSCAALDEVTALQWGDATFFSGNAFGLVSVWG